MKRKHEHTITQPKQSKDHKKDPMYDQISIPTINDKHIGFWWPHQSIQQVLIVENERNVEMSRYFTAKNLPPRRCRLMNLPSLLFAPTFSLLYLFLIHIIFQSSNSLQFSALEHSVSKPHSLFLCFFYSLSQLTRTTYFPLFCSNFLSVFLPIFFFPKVPPIQDILKTPSKGEHIICDTCHPYKRHFCCPLTTPNSSCYQDTPLPSLKQP